MRTSWGSIPDLSTLRQKRGISLGQIAAQTKIGVHYLEGIERGQFTKLPGGIYNTSYIRQYARAIGFPEDDLLRVYRETNPPKLTFPFPEGD
jgi:cytoskeletal protein RodZ